MKRKVYHILFENNHSEIILQDMILSSCLYLPFTWTAVYHSDDNKSYRQAMCLILGECRLAFPP